MTAKKVEHNLKVSPYTLSVNGLRLFFSSDFYRQKFEELAREKTDYYNSCVFRDIENKEQLTVILLYCNSEKRGFYIEGIKGSAIKCLKVE